MEPDKIKINEDGVSIEGDFQPEEPKKETSNEDEGDNPTERPGKFLSTINFIFDMIISPFVAFFRIIEFILMYDAQLTLGLDFNEQQAILYRENINIFKNENPSHEKLDEEKRIHLAFLFNESVKHKDKVYQLGMYLLLTKLILFGILYSLILLYFFVLLVIK